MAEYEFYNGVLGGFVTNACPFSSRVPRVRERTMFRALESCSDKIAKACGINVLHLEQGFPEFYSPIALYEHAPYRPYINKRRKHKTT